MPAEARFCSPVKRQIWPHRLRSICRKRGRCRHRQFGRPAASSSGWSSRRVRSASTANTATPWSAQTSTVFGPTQERQTAGHGQFPPPLPRPPRHPCPPACHRAPDRHRFLRNPPRPAPYPASRPRFDQCSTPETSFAMRRPKRMSSSCSSVSFGPRRSRPRASTASASGAARSA
jgi:hypothetical protein